MSIWLEKLRNLWIRGGAEKREEIERIWPELAEAIDMEMISNHLRLPDPPLDVRAGLKEVFERGGIDMTAKDIDDLLNKVGPKSGESCDGCRTIDRAKLRIKPGDETGAYELQRAARHHRKECPNT